MSLLCKQLNIILIRLYPNSTQFYQPADRGLFKPLKALYKKFIDFNKTFNDKPVDKKSFAQVLGRIHNEIDKDWVVNAFRSCGLYPWNPAAIDYEALNIGSASNSDNIPLHEDIVELRNMTSDNASYDIMPINYDSLVSESEVLSCEGNIISLDSESGVVLWQDDNENPVQSCIELEVVPFNGNIVSLDSESGVASFQSNVVTLNSESRDALSQDNIEKVMQSNIEPPLNLRNLEEFNSHITTESPTTSSGKKTSASSSFKRAKSFYSTDSPYTKFVQIIGPKIQEEFEKSHFIEEVGTLYQTYQMLKADEEERLCPLTLPQHKKPTRKGKVIQKRSFVSVSEDYIDVMQERKRKNDEVEVIKKKRKIEREEKRLQKENLVIEGSNLVHKQRGRPRKPLISKEININ